MKTRLYAAALLAALCFFAPTSSAQVENERLRAAQKRPQPFFFDALNFAQIDSFGVRSRLDLYVKVPYDVIRFIKGSDNFQAHYSVTILISDEAGDRLREESWEQNLAQETFEGTVSQTAFDLTQRSFLLPPGPVILEAIVEDRESAKEYRLTKRIEVRKFDPNLFCMSDIMIVSKVGESGGKKIITPHVAANVSGLKNEFFLFFEIYNPFAAQVIRMQYEARSSKNVVGFTKDERQQLREGKNTFITRIGQGSFDIGTYSLKITARRPDDTTAGGLLTSAQTSFTMEWTSTGTPISITDLDAAIEQLRYFAKTDEISHIKEAKDEKEKRVRFEEFWERQNPIPGSKTNVKMLEYYNRVSYANEHFKHFLEGWRTDRGMVYIINGAPSYVDRHPFEVETKPYEIWEYYDLNRRYIFIDESGFGDYRLLYPFWDERNRLN